MGQTNPKDSSRIRGDARARREQRRAEALERQAEFDKLSLREKIDRIEVRPGHSDRETAKLLKQSMTK